MTKNGITKTELRMVGRKAAVAAVFAALLSAHRAFASSTDGAPSPTIRQEAGAQGRAFITVDDLKTLLGLVARDPSAVESRSNKDESTDSFDFILALSPSQKKALANSIRRIEVKRAEVASLVEKQAAEQRQELRQKRRSLQLSRLSSSSKKDSEIGQNLFESVLSEANNEARAAQELERFDAEHVVAIDFHTVDSTRVAQAISIGDSMIWNAARVASR